jgi:hypothetical protein
MLRHASWIVLASCFLIAGFIAGAHSQSKSFDLERFDSEKAEVSKIEWILLESRIRILEDVLRDDLRIPLTLLNQYYDSKKKKVISVVRVDTTWLNTKSVTEVKNQLDAWAARVCLAPMLTNYGAKNLIFLSARAPKDYSYVEFNCLEQNLHVKQIAIYENGELTLK